MSVLARGHDGRKAPMVGDPMSLLVAGLFHRSPPVDVLERVAVSCADADKVLHELLEREHVAEALLLPCPGHLPTG